MAQANPPCSVGLALNDDCHKTNYCRTSGLTSIESISLESKALLEWRSGVSVQPGDMLCSHHEKVFISRYESLQKSCCDPFEAHKKLFKKHLRVIDEETAKILKKKPGQKLCRDCHTRLQRKIDAHETVLASSEEEFPATPLHDFSKLDTGLQELGCSPLKSVGRRDRHAYAKRKARGIHSASKSKIAKVLDLNESDLSSSSRECQKCEDFSELITLLKEKCKTATRQQKIKFLTLAPVSWSIRKVASEFGVTCHIVRRARELKKRKGILAEPDKNRGKPLASDIVDRVKEFFQSDEFSRMCPGKKDFVPVAIDNNRIEMQKRLLLVNLKELHIEYEKKYGTEIGFSKFCELRPKWCVPVNSAGMHSVCVCQSHQNVKLMMSAIPTKLDYKEMLGKMVCSIENRNCMLLLCDSCPGKDILREYIAGLFSENDVDLEDTITYRQWTHTDRTSLVMLQSPLDEFVDAVCNAFDNLRQHHFVMKSQSSYLKSLKEDIPDNSAIVLLDFAENYSFVIQDAVQGFYWDNSQATLHPFAVYYKDSNDEVVCHSICMISNSLKHETASVHAFISILVPYIKELVPGIEKVIYFSDGAASQYKNYKNISNICHHQSDYGLKAEWNFFATSHGKSPCDGIGGTVKRLVARASLQATIQDHILTAEQMFQWSCRNIKGIKFFYVSSDDIQKNSDTFQIDDRFSSAKTIAGTRSHHSFVPISENQMQMKRISADDIFNLVTIGSVPVNNDPIGPVPEDTNKYQPGKYIACMYDSDWYIGNISERSEEQSDILVRFMKRSDLTLSWPPDTRRNQCWVPLQHVLCSVSVPELQGRGARHYKLSQVDYDNIQSRLI